MAVFEKETFHKIPLDALANGFSKAGFSVTKKLNSFKALDFPDLVIVKYIPERDGCLVKIKIAITGKQEMADRVEEAIRYAKANKDDKTSSKSNFCPSCGEKLPANAKFCPNCGEKVK